MARASISKVKNFCIRKATLNVEKKAAKAANEIGEPAIGKAEKAMQLNY